MEFPFINGGIPNRNGWFMMGKSINKWKMDGFFFMEKSIYIIYESPIAEWFTMENPKKRIRSRGTPMT
jgi:hypothetical protein